MKGFFETKPRGPVELMHHTRELLVHLGDSCSVSRDSKREKKMEELNKHLQDIKSVLYGDESEPNPDACSKVTQEFFKEDTLKLLIFFLPNLDLEARKDATQIVANLQRQRVNYKLIASDYLEENKDLLDHLMVGYEDMDLALHYGAMLRECIRHQNVARYVLESPHMKRFFDYVQLPNYDIASNAFATFKELLTRHKSTVAEFLKSNYEWFFAEFNTKLLVPPSYINRRQSTKLLGEILLDRSNSSVMIQYVSSKENLKILMNLLKDSSTTISLAAFDVFKVFVANKSKPPEIVDVLVVNRSKLLQFLGGFNPPKVGDNFEVDKALVVNEITMLQP